MSGPGDAPHPDDLHLGTVLPTREMAIVGDADPGEVLELARQLEDEGVDSLWVGESVLARPRIDALTMLAGVAAVTRRVTIGSAVVLPALRNPVSIAHQVASLDQLASGRLVLGVGAGFPGPDSRREFDALGADYSRRVGALDATVGTMRAHWSRAARPDSSAEDEASFHPPPVQPGGPPVWLAAGTASGLARCGRAYDGWLPYPVTPDEYAAGLRSLRQAAADAGRDPDRVTPALYLTVALGEGSAAHERLDEYCTAYYGAPRELVGLVQAMLSGTLDEVAHAVWRYVEAGARHLVIRHGTLDRAVVRDEAPRLHERLRRMWSRLG
jgi:alkanesulfonate monooxygenase SsuD/methylene tetrahydromethanopterin reductase-like flavin-dependent oxidoreductase (luciferase family)